MKNKQTSHNKRNFAIVASIAVMITVVAVVLIFLYTRQLKPDVVEVNAQNNAASENVGYINEDSPQVLENEPAEVKVSPIANSPVVIAGSGIFMIIIVVSFGVVKFMEKKDN